MSKTALKALVLSEQPDNTQQLIKPVNVRTVDNAIIDESLNIKDGGLYVEQLAGYKTLINISDDKAFTHKKYVDDALALKQDRLNGIVSGCEITVETFAGTGTNKQIRVTDGTWYISPSEYTKATDTVSAEITLCVTGGDFKYYDIVADNTNAITIHEGTPSTAPAHYVIDPLTQVLLGFITVGDAVIEEPVPIVSGFIPLTGTSAMTGSFNSPPAIYPSGRYSSGLLYGQIETVLSQITDNPAGDTRIYENKVRVHYNGIASEVLDRLDPSKDRIFSVLRGTKFVFTGDIAVYIGLTHAEIAAKIAADPYALITRQYADDKYAGTVITTATTAKDSTTYHTEGIFTITDPTGVEGKGYDVLVLTGEVTVGGTPYSTSGTYIRRRYVSGVWVTYLGGGSGTTQSSQAQVEAAFDNTNQTTPVVLEQTSALTPFNAWWLVQKIKTWVKAGFTLTGSLNFAPSVSLASSTNPALGATASNNVTITGTTTIAGFDNVADGITRVVKFSGILQLTYNATSLILPTSANITTSAGDIAVFRSLGSGNWECIDYTRKDGSALVSGGPMAANTIKGNNTGSTANAADLTTDQFTAMMEIAVAVGTTGIITAMTSATYKYIRLTSASATGLGGIVAPSSSYKDLYIWNDTGVTLTLYHDYSSEATAANRILCGANRSWANNTMLHLKYDVTESRWCTVAQDGNTFRALLAGTGTRLVAATSSGQEEATIQTLDIDFSGAQQTSATTASWTGVNEVNIAGLLQGQLYIDYATTGYRYECHRNDWCSRTPVINVEVFTTNSLYPIFEVTGTSGTFGEDEAYVLNNASLVTMALPSTGTQGKVIIVNGKGAGGWKITVPNTQQIVGGATNTTTAGSGYIEATGGTKQYAAVTLKCITSGTAAVWEIVSTNPATTLTIA